MKHQTGKSGLTEAGKMCGCEVKLSSQDRQTVFILHGVGPRAHARTCAAGTQGQAGRLARRVSYGHSLQTVCPAVTGHRSYSGLLYRRAPSQCPVSMSRSASQGHRVTFLRLFGILPPGLESHARACPPVRCVCVCLCIRLVCLSCHKLHSVAGEASQEELR